MYFEIYDILNHYIFNDLAAEFAHMDLVLTFFSTAACVFCAALPFVIVWRVIKLLAGR